MNADRLLALYDRVAEAPDAVARLRRFVLDLTVRGKLVAQDPTDEPASALLERIAAAKARLVKAKMMRKSKEATSLSSDDPPFPVPRGWAWTQIAQLGIINPRNEAHDDVIASFVPMPLIAAEYGVPNGHQPRRWGDIKTGYTHFREGDVGLAKITPCFENGKSTVFRDLTGGIGAGTTELHVVRPLLVEAGYILLILKSPYFIETGIPRMTGTAGQKRVPTEYFASSPFPLPPLAEQGRILKKVDELMVLLDRLEAARATREATRDRFTAANLAYLANAEPMASDFALNALPVLTARADQLKTLRQTILSLAVRGKLVAQDPTDEPASALLQTVEAEKRCLDVKHLVEPLDEDEAPFALPKGWSWTRLGEISSKTGSGSTPRGGKDVYKKSGVPFLRSQNIYNEGLRLDDVVFIDAQTNARMKGTRVLPGDLLLNITGGSMGRCGIVPETLGESNVSQHVAIIRPAVKGMNAFLHRLVLSPYFQAFIFDEQTGAGRGGLPKNRMDRIAIALPPLAEQYRIVAKVDALMALCDRLEGTLSATETTRARLLDALLCEALTPPPMTRAA